MKGTDLIEAIEFGHPAMMPLIEMRRGSGKNRKADEADTGS